MINFCFLLDKRNNWLQPYALKYLNDINLNAKKHIIYDPIDAEKYEICFVLAYTTILNNNDLFKSCKYFIVHESSLPKGKGFAPLMWQIIEGKNEIDFCLLELAESVDAGRIVLNDKLLLNGNELYAEIREKQAKKTFKLINEFIKLYPNINFIKQAGKESFYKRRSPKDSELNINKNLKEQFNLLRTCNNNSWPAYFEINGQKYFLKISKSSK